jgi:hypothetical protein
MMHSLEHHALNQASSVIELRYREVVDNLAQVADNPAALPAYSSIFNGIAQVTDTEQLVSTTQWQNIHGANPQRGYASEMANPQVSRVVLENWTLDPVVIPEKLEAIRCACRWAIYGPDHTGDYQGLLPSPDQAPGPGRHFGVADRLAHLPPGWLHVEKRKSPPLCACYKSHAGDVWVWVTPDGLKGLADFTLVLQDIVRVDSNSSTLFNTPPNPSTLKFAAVSKDKRNEGCTFAAMVSVDACGHIVPPPPYFRGRIDNVSSPSSLRSQINAAGATR